MKMSFVQWDFLQMVYEENASGFNPDVFRFSKRTLHACLKNGWVEIIDDGVVVTEKGKRDAENQITKLYTTRGFRCVKR
ncbi:hypothetical protein ACLMAB_05720 [Brevibacillus laterosporus]